MWQELVVYAIIAVAGGLTLWRFYQKLTGKGSCCSGGCSEGCACPSGRQPEGAKLPMAGGGSCCCK